MWVVAARCSLKDALVLTYTSMHNVMTSLQVHTTFLLWQFCGMTSTMLDAAAQLRP